MSEIYKMYRLRIMLTIIIAFVVICIISLGAVLFTSNSDNTSQIDLQFIKISSRNIGALFMSLGIALLAYLIKSIPKITIQKKDERFTLNANETDN